MNRRTILTGFVALALLLSGCSAVPGVSQSTATQTDTPTATPPDVPDDAADAATQLKRNLEDEGYTNARVLVSPDGESVIVQLSPKDGRVKERTKDVALVYAETLDEDSDLGRLTVHIPDVKAYVPRATAQAYNAGKIKKTAYFETIVYGEVKTPQEGN